NGWWYMPPEPVPADPGWDDDPAWSRPDPMTAEERAASLDRLCERDEGYREEDSGDFAPLTAEELAEIREAAADELLAVKAATTGRRGPGQPGSAGVFPGESASPAAGFGPGMALDVLPGCAGRAESLIGLAQTLQTHLPGTAAALQDGTITRYKAEIIASATAFLDAAGARAAENEVLDRAARLTPGGLRAAIARAVMAAAPEKAKERREAAARDARVERWIQDSGNAALMGCELPPDQVLAADQRITARARELRAAGLEGDMDQLRARAYLDLLLGKDSRPRPVGPQPGTPGHGNTPGLAPAGFAGRVTLTVPLA